MDSATPMQSQYLAIKREHQDKILFFRLGDFYEMFYEDAEIAARELEITLTSREGGRNQRVPMAGIPYHAADSYISRLIEKGYKIAICEQMEDPRLAKGLVRREVVRIITPGTAVDTRLLDDKSSNYLVSLAGSSQLVPREGAVTSPAAAGRTGAPSLVDRPGSFSPDPSPVTKPVVPRDSEAFGLALVEASTGEFAVTEFSGPDALNRLLEELGRLEPRECLLAPTLQGHTRLNSFLKEQLRATVTPYRPEFYDPALARRKLLDQLQVVSLRGFGCDDLLLAIAAAGALLHYLEETQKTTLTHINRLRTYHPEEYMVLDAATRRHLELVRRFPDGARKGSLLWALDETVTAMGGRLLREWIERPLKDLVNIQARLQSVRQLVEDAFLRTDLRDLFRSVLDLERLLGKVIYGTATPRDLLALRQSLSVLPKIKGLLTARAAEAGAEGGQPDPYFPELLSRLAREIEPLTDLEDLIQRALREDAPLSAREGGIIREGFHPEVDRLREAQREGKNWIAALEGQEREKTGIKSLKVGFNKVFGYYLEVTNPNLPLVPAYYLRKQTLANAERYITPELREKEDLILGAEERLSNLEYEIFSQLREQVAGRAAPIQASARAIAQLDALASLAEVSRRHDYQEPSLTQDSVILLKEARHPVLERILPTGTFVPNDVFIDGEEDRVLIITGPNMGGKSTYMRQTALNVLLAQMGCFVPAREARIGLVDRLFTRIGAWDDLSSGQSTFMVEMAEVANILNHATSRSLVLLDEIGRGTSTFDGLAIAWAVVEYLQDKERLGARTLLATHYRELIELEDLLEGVKNYSVAVREKGEEMVFLRRVVRGGADGSYGIQVARLAGIPAHVIARAKEILHTLENREQVKRGNRRRSARNQAGYVQLTFFEPLLEPVLEEIRSLDVMSLTPLEALQKIHAWQERLKK